MRIALANLPLACISQVPMAEDGAVTMEECDNGLAIITLDRQKALNAANVPMVKELRRVLREAKEKDSIKAVLLKGAGEKGFSSGGDVKTVSNVLAKDINDVSAKEQFYEEYNFIYEFKTFPKPSVALAHGITMGFGMGVSVCATISVATAKSRFAMPENNIGLFPDAGFTYHASKLTPGVGRLMGLTACHFIGAGDVMKAGLATHYVPFEKFEGLIAALKQADLSKTAKSAIKAAVEGMAEAAPDPTLLNSDGLELAAKLAKVANVKEAYELLEEASKVEGSWAATLVPAMKKGSPFSQAMVFKLLKSGEADAPFRTNRSLNGIAAALEREYIVASRIILRPDFTEGVRAVLVDKDNNAKWQPAAPEEVDAKELNEMLKPFSKDTAMPILDLPRWVPPPVPVDPPLEGAVEMKVTAKKGTVFYVRAASRLLKGLEAKPAADGKEALEAKAPVDALRISGLGESINSAIAAARAAESEGLCTIIRVQTANPNLEGANDRSSNCAQILIDVKKK